MLLFNSIFTDQELQSLNREALEDLVVDLAELAMDAVGNYCYSLADYDAVKYQVIINTEEVDVGELHHEAYNTDHYDLGILSCNSKIDAIGYRGILAFVVSEESYNLGGEGLLEQPYKGGRLHPYASRLEALIMDPVMLLDNFTYWIGDRVLSTAYDKASESKDGVTYKNIRAALYEIRDEIKNKKEDQ